jgi:hypothetical protein
MPALLAEALLPFRFRYPTPPFFSEFLQNPDVRLQRSHFAHQTIPIDPAFRFALRLGSGRLASLKSRQQFRERHTEAPCDQRQCVKRYILFAALQRSRECSMDMGFGGEHLLAPSPELPQLANAVPERLAEAAQFVPEGIKFRLRFAHLRESGNSPPEPLHSPKRHLLYFIAAGGIWLMISARIAANVLLQALVRHGEYSRFALLIALPALLFGAKTQEWKTGKVLDSATYVPAGATTNTTVTTTGNTADATSRTTIRTIIIRDRQPLIVSDDFAYVIEDTRVQSGFTNVHSAVISAVSGRHAVEVCR